jgi:hypothetical protein
VVLVEVKAVSCGEREAGGREKSREAHGVSRPARRAARWIAKGERISHASFRSIIIATYLLPDACQPYDPQRCESDL